MIYTSLDTIVVARVATVSARDKDKSNDRNQYSDKNLGINRQEILPL
jgi:hypothetical protein